MFRIMYAGQHILLAAVGQRVYFDGKRAIMEWTSSLLLSLYFSSATKGLRCPVPHTAAVAMNCCRQF